MILSQEVIDYIQTVTSTANALGLDIVIIEPDLVRAVDVDQTIFIIQSKDVPSIPCEAIGINRLKTFMARLDIVKSLGKNFQIEVILNDTTNNPKANQFARALIMKDETTKLDYRCGNPSLMKSPRGFRDDFAYGAQMTPDTYTLIQKVKAAMGTDAIDLIGTNDGLLFKIVDDNGDAFVHTFAKKIDVLDPEIGDDINFTHKYPLQHILSIFRNNTNGYFQITKNKGLLQTNINGLETYVAHREE